MTDFARKTFLALALFALLPLSAQAQDAERILSFHSDIQIQADATVLVTETIKVVSAGDQIRRGIYRDYPIAYTDDSGRRYVVGFDLLGVTRDGQAESHHIERSGNGLRVYLGQEDVILEPDVYEYAISYRTDRQLGFFAEHDELYWNVTGDGWVFPIGMATATVRLPDGIAPEDITGKLYTGPRGSTAEDGTWQVTDEGVVQFLTTQPLAPREGLTIVVGWPKGVVTPPTASENFWAGVKSNLDYLVGLTGILGVLGFYLRAWHKRGRDPKSGPIIAQYESPQGLSPAMIRYIQRMGPDNRALAAAIINMGVKGQLDVTEAKAFLKKTTYTLAKKSGPLKSALSTEEKILDEKLFKGADTVVLEQKNAAALSKVRDSFNASLKSQAGQRYFKKNGGLLALGIVMSIAVFVLAIVAAVWVRYDANSPLFVIFWIVLALGLVIMNIVFGIIIRAYTPEGRQLADEIEGFKLFLNVTEKDRLTFHNPPEQTPALFEAMLPFALALGVEHQWAKQFASVFARLKEQGAHYAPLWYHGATTHFAADDFASNMGSTFTGVVASSSTPPGSSSGMSGGSSGGGGGGGGGGGW